MSFVLVLVNNKEELELGDLVLIHAIEFYTILVSFFQLVQIPNDHPVKLWATIKPVITSNDIFNFVIVILPVWVYAMDCITLIYADFKTSYIWTDTLNLNSKSKYIFVASSKFSLKFNVLLVSQILSIPGTQDPIPCCLFLGTFWLWSIAF